MSITKAASHRYDHQGSSRSVWQHLYHGCHGVEGQYPKRHRLCTSTGHPGITATILIEIQQIVNHTFIQRIIRYSLNMYDRYRKLPMVVIFCVSSVQPKALLDDFQPVAAKSSMPSTQCKRLARQCPLVVKSSTLTTSAIRSNPGNQLIFYGKQPCLAIHPLQEDEVIQLLYSICTGDPQVWLRCKRYGPRYHHGCLWRQRYWDDVNVKVGTPTINITLVKRAMDRAWKSYGYWLLHWCIVTVGLGMSRSQAVQRTKSYPSYRMGYRCYCDMAVAPRIEQCHHTS